MKEDVDVSSKTPARLRLFWLPALLAGIPWICYFYFGRHGGAEGLAALSGAAPNHHLEWAGAEYLAARYASALISPGLLIGSAILWCWEKWSCRGQQR